MLRGAAGPPHLRPESLYICGEAYSDALGGVKGAHKIADMMLVNQTKPL